MQKIPITLAKPGMKLAKPVARDNGITIMAEGMELTDALISRLDSLNIEAIVVKGNPVDMGEDGGGTSFDERMKRMDHLFSIYTQDKWMVKVRERMKAYFKFKAAAQAARERAEREAELAAAEAEREAAEAAENGEGGEA